MLVSIIRLQESFGAETVAGGLLDSQQYEAILFVGNKQTYLNG